MKEVTPHGLVKFGLIPELVGRLPVITALSDLDKAALVRILTEPKNCLVSQYKKLFDPVRSILSSPAAAHCGKRLLPAKRQRVMHSVWKVPLKN